MFCNLWLNVCVFGYLCVTCQQNSFIFNFCIRFLNIYLVLSISLSFLHLKCYSFSQYFALNLFIFCMPSFVFDSSNCVGICLYALNWWCIMDFSRLIYENKRDVFLRLNNICSSFTMKMHSIGRLETNWLLWSKPQFFQISSKMMTPVHMNCVENTFEHFITFNANDINTCVWISMIIQMLLYFINYIRLHIIINLLVYGTFLDMILLQYTRLVSRLC